MRSAQNVALVVSGLALTNPYVGQGVYALRLIQGLTQRLGNRFIVVAPPTLVRPPEIEVENFLNLPLFRVPRHALLNHGIASYHLLRFVAERFPGATFHSPGPIVGLTKPPKIVITLHDCLYRHFSQYNGRFHLRRLLSQWAERFAANATLVLTDSEFSRQDLISRTRIPADKLKVVYPWVGNEFLTLVDRGAVDAVRERLQLPKRFWLYLGGYDYRKNVEFLIAAYAEAGHRSELPPLVLAGDIPTKKHLATCDVGGAIRRHHLTAAQVIESGLIPAADLPALYRAAALLIYPSLGEGFGLPPAEAIAVGTPILASNATSLPEVVRNPHCLFDPQGLAALVNKLIAAADNETQFVAELPAAFMEGRAISRYLDVLGLE